MKKVSAFLLATLAMFAVMAGSAQAAIDASVGTAFNAIQTDANSLSAIVTPIVVAILGLVIVIKLIKRFGNKL
jgi:hypothetical protein